MKKKAQKPLATQIREAKDLLVRAARKWVAAESFDAAMPASILMVKYSERLDRLEARKRKRP